MEISENLDIISSDRVFKAANGLKESDRIDIFTFSEEEEDISGVLKSQELILEIIQQTQSSAEEGEHPNGEEGIKNMQAGLPREALYEKAHEPFHGNNREANFEFLKLAFNFREVSRDKGLEDLDNIFWEE